jgi:hypothetical protein
MMSMVKLAMIVEMPFRDLRFFFILDFTHFTVATFPLLSETASFTDIDRFSKNREVQTRHQDPPTFAHLAYRVTGKLNWLLREVTSVTVYALPPTKVNELVENEPHPVHPVWIPMLTTPTAFGWIVGPQVYPDWVYVVPVAFFT